MTVSVDEQKLTVSAADDQKTMKRVVVDHYGGPEVLKVVEADIPELLSTSKTNEGDASTIATAGCAASTVT